MKGLFKTIVIVVALFLIASPLFAEIPHLISYQGKLGDAEGKPLTGSYNITFRIYDAETGGNLKWSEAHSGVVVNKGYFSLMLGSLTSLNLPFDQPYWLTIQVGGDPEMTPRQRIASAGYAYRAERAEIDNTEDIIMRGFEVTYKGPGDLYVEPGILFHGFTKIKKTSRTVLTLVNDSDWIDVSKPASLANLWVYVYSDSAGNLKLQETSPNKADTAGNIEGKKFYYYYPTGDKYYRWLGSIRTNGASQIIKFRQAGDWIRYDVEQIALNNGTATTYTDVDLSSFMPVTSQLVWRAFKVWYLGDQYPQYDTHYYDRANGSSMDVMKGGFATPYPDFKRAGEGMVDTDSSQVIEYKLAGYGGTSKNCNIYVLGYYNPRN